ncbi:hypothetical protein QYE76_052653 [Lolium multiflorum]|uniref:Uncharacterized protein n=1 Tax=Lolium multiflorum TaxID=4521 RepID=A0AAD8WJD3_LOLMU|nr:hypothetical protein QYE76_052653 [Lolium multiflorum]
MRRPALERNKDAGASASGAKAPPPPSRLDGRGQAEPPALTHGADPAPSKDTEEPPSAPPPGKRKKLAAAGAVEITQREYNRAHGLTPGGDNPSRAGQIRRRGRDLGAEIDRDGADEPAPSMELPIYNTPDKNMLAAEAAAEELPPRKRKLRRRQAGGELRRGGQPPSAGPQVRPCPQSFSRSWRCRQGPRRSEGHGRVHLPRTKPAGRQPEHPRKLQPHKPAAQWQQRSQPATIKPA